MGLDVLTMLIIAIGLIVLVVLLVFVIIYNGLIRLRKNIDKSWSNIDVLLKQRNDELPKLVETVKGYMRYEKGVLTEITKARSLYTKATTLQQKAKADTAITSALKTLFAVAENYPNLQAMETYKQLQTRISGLENELADRREFYNDSVTEFNTKINSIPDTFVARMLHYTDQPVFKAEAAERKDVKIELP